MLHEESLDQKKFKRTIWTTEAKSSQISIH